MITDETKPEDFKNIKQTTDYTQIKGWGIDADPENDPTYPMKARNKKEHSGYNWDRPEQQLPSVEILQSVERPNMTAVFGTAVPPSGISGLVRRIAYKYSESDYRRWLPLILADRINMVEGVVDDLIKGHVPNVFDELGWNAELKYNKKQFLIKVAAGAAVTTAIAIILYKNKKSSTLNQK